MDTQNQKEIRKSFSVGDLYSLCNKEQFFTAGDSKQYNKFFDYGQSGVTLRELAIMLYMCSTHRDDVVYTICEKFFATHGAEV